MQQSKRSVDQVVKKHLVEQITSLSSSSSTSTLLTRKKQWRSFSSMNTHITTKTTMLMKNKNDLFSNHATKTLSSYSNSTKSFSSNTNTTPCPYKTLSIPKSSTYAKAKTSFLKIAMKNHPDTLQQHISKDTDDYEKKMKQSVELFRNARLAFESLVEDDNGNCRLKIEVEAEEEMTEGMSNEQFDAWFLNETGHSNPYSFDLDPQTMREVAEAAETMGGGAERDGGMWGLARMIGNTVKDGKNKGNVLRLEAGDVRTGENEDDDYVDGKLRRRRRRGGGAKIVR